MLLGSLFQNFIVLLVTLTTIIIVYFRRTYRYWQKRNVPYLEPHVPYGNFSSPFKRKENFALTLQKLYNAMKAKGWKHGGVYSFLTPVYVPVDLDYVKSVMTKDFQHFVDRGTYYNEKDDPLSAHLFALGGTKWKNLRTKLTPTFTSGKMKAMFPTVMECGARLLDQMESEYQKKVPIDIKELLACFTTDVIGSSAFGLELKSFEQKDSPFRKYGKKVIEKTSFRVFKQMFTNSLPTLSRILSIKVLPVDVGDFFMGVVKDAVNYRETNSFTRSDFLQLLINLKNNNKSAAALTIEEIAAQSFVFFVAGYETSSTTMTFTLYELARNQEIQDKVRHEIELISIKNNGVITYDLLQDLHYMDQVIDETLRKYPAVPFVTRQCISDYKPPDGHVVIEKGTFTIIPILGIHYDEEYYPEPQKFDPERFNEKHKSLRNNYAHIPFGEGPRMCIGMRFGFMQMKVGLITLLRNFKFTVNGKTKEPLRMCVNPTILSAEGEIWLNAHALQ